MKHILAVLLALFGVHSWSGHHGPAIVLNPAPTSPLRADGCLECHVYKGTGATNLGAPRLTHEGGRRRGVAWQIRHLRCPSCLVPGSPMPSFRALSPAQLRRLAGILEASK